MNILAVTCMRNEGPYCLEWIAHHRAAGFTDFLIYTHDCTDGTDTLLDLLPNVTHVHFDKVDGKSVQWQAMQMADQHALMKNADWVMFFDCDEFLCLDAPLSSVSDLVNAMPGDTDAVALPWHLFGSSHHIEWDQGLTLDRFTHAAPDNIPLPAGHFFKSLFRPSKFQKLGVHRPKNKKDATPNWQLGGAQTAPDAFVKDDKRINLFGLMKTAPKARLNHYSTRSVTEFVIKRERGLPNRRTKDINLSYWAERNFNTTPDSKIKHMVPATRSALDALLAIETLRACQDQCTAAHQSIFKELMEDRDAVMLFLHLSLLSGSTPPTPDRIRAHLSHLANLSA